MRPEWDALVASSCRDEPFYRHDFLLTYLDRFEPDAKLRVFLVRERGQLVAALPLVEERAWSHAIPLLRLRAPANVHSCRFDLVCAAGREDALCVLWEKVCQTVRFDAIELRDVPPEGVARALARLAESQGHAVAAAESWRTPYIPLQGGFAAVMAGLDAKFRSNLRRRRKKLEELGRVEVQRADGAGPVDRLLEEGLALESSGWKGREGTAIACDAATRGFYLDLARRAAGAGELALYFLRVGGRAVAFQYGLEHGGVYSVPKLAYDERFAACSPGHLLLESILQDGCGRGWREFDFLGPSMPWKLEWTDRVRVHHGLTLYGRTPAGRALAALKTRVAPAVKRLLKGV